jgi:hypothetical protein
MKKILVPFVVASILILAGCKSGAGGDPKLVLTNFFDALAKKDFTTAKKYTTKDSEGLLNMIQMGMQNMGDKSNEMAKFEKENIELGAAVINGDRATVPVKEKQSGETTDFTLKQESGDWKVAFDKSTLMEMAQKKMKEHGFGGMPHNGMKDSSEGMHDVQKIMDSANKILNDEKK